MSKRNKARKEQQRALVEARRPTLGKIVRTALKMFVFAIAASLAVSLAAALGVPGLELFWVQLLVMLLLYIPAYPIVMSEFRPRRPPPGRLRGR